MDFMIDDLFGGKNANPILPGKYKLEMSVLTYRNWSIGFNVPITERVAELAVFLRDNGATVFLSHPPSVPMTDEHVLMASRLVNMGIPVYALKDMATDFDVLNHVWYHLSLQQPHILIDTEYSLTSHIEALRPHAAQSVGVVIETVLDQAPPFFLNDQANMYKCCAIVLPDDRFTFRVIDLAILAWKKLRGSYVFDCQDSDLVPLVVYDEEVEDEPDAV